MSTSRGLFPQACGESFRLLSRTIGRERLVSYALKSTSREMTEALAFTGMETDAVEVISLAIMAAAISFSLVAVTGLAAMAAGLLDGLTASILVVCAAVLPVVSFVFSGRKAARPAITP